MNMGNKIRDMRKRHGLNMKELAGLVGVSYLTIQRIETDKVSPSVAVLSDIAYHLGEPITNFFEKEATFAIVRKGTRPKIQSGKVDLELLIPKGVINDRISVSLGRVDAGNFVSPHSHPGFELTFNLKGRANFKYGHKEYELQEGDLIYFDSSIEHSVSVFESHEFLAIYFREGA